MEKWGQTLADPRVLSVEAADAGSRERFLALYTIAESLQLVWRLQFLRRTVFCLEGGQLQQRTYDSVLSQRDQMVGG
jgi:hypothetical protein